MDKVAEKEEERLKLVHNEQMKLRATFFNNVGILALGGVALGIGIARIETLKLTQTILLVLMGIIACFGSHFYALSFLKKLK